MRPSAGVLIVVEPHPWRRMADTVHGTQPLANIEAGSCQSFHGFLFKLLVYLPLRVMTWS